MAVIHRLARTFETGRPWRCRRGRRNSAWRRSTAGVGRSRPTQAAASSNGASRMTFVAGAARQRHHPARGRNLDGAVSQASARPEGGDRAARGHPAPDAPHDAQSQGDSRLGGPRLAQRGEAHALPEANGRNEADRGGAAQLLQGLVAAETIYEISGLSSPQARLEIDMWVVPNATRVVVG